jgi:Ca2+/Na+ antiporter
LYSSYALADCVVWHVSCPFTIKYFFWKTRTYGKRRVVEPTTKEIALGVLSGSAAIASILLVFVGFIMVKAEGLSDSAPVSMVNRFTLDAQVGLVPLIAQVGVMLTAYAWLFWPYSRTLYLLWSIGFVVGVALFLAYAIYIVLRI